MPSTAKVSNATSTLLATDTRQNTKAVVVLVEAETRDEEA